MPKKLQKSLQECLTKLKKPTPSIQFPSNSFSSSKNWILSGCKHTKTLSFAMDRNQDKAGKNKGGEATLSDVDRFLFENFKSLYIEGDDEDRNYNEKKKGKESDEGENPSGAVLFGSPRSMDLPADLCGSHRFFVAPSMSSSIIEESQTSGTSMSEDAGTSSSTSTTTTLNDSTTTTTTTTTNEDHHAKDDHHRDVTLPEDCVAVLAYSPSPYEDFRRSMQEMVEARGMRNHGKVEWSFMEELLFSYLNLNEKKSYRYIISAFVDLMVVLSQDSERDRSEPDRGGHEKKRDVGIL